MTDDDDKPRTAEEWAQERVGRSRKVFRETADGQVNLAAPSEINARLREVDGECFRKAMAQARAEGFRAGQERMRERAAEVLEEWLAAYPESVFPPPPPRQHGSTVDQCSAEALRKTIPGNLAAIRALPPEEEG